MNLLFLILACYGVFCLTRQVWDITEAAIALVRKTSRVADTLLAPPPLIRKKEAV